MKTLILCVDRDDDLGVKGGVSTPVVGRRRCVEAATALGLADPEDSDTNALFAAVNLLDQELRTQGPTDQVEVACIAGHKALGLRADRKLAQELNQVLQAVRPDGVILVSDGAEDEQILPILNSHAKVVHVHRSVVKQAPRLEGFYYVITRILDDEKQAKRFVLPVALILLMWGLSYLLGVQRYAWGATLAVLGLWLTIHAMQWEEAFGRFFREMGDGVNKGRIGLLATLVMAAILGYAAFVGWDAMRSHDPPEGVVLQYPDLYRALLFLQAFLPYFVSALLVRTAGSLFDAWARDGRAGVGHWNAAFLLIAFGFIGPALTDIAIDVFEAKPYIQALGFDRILMVSAGAAVLAGGIIVSRYIRAMVAPRRDAR